MPQRTTPTATEADEQPLDLPPISFTERVKEAGARMLAPVSGVAERVRSALRRAPEESAPADEATLVSEREPAPPAARDETETDASSEATPDRAPVLALARLAGVAGIAAATAVATTWWVMREDGGPAEPGGSRIGAEVARKAAAVRGGIDGSLKPGTSPAGTSGHDAAAPARPDQPQQAVAQASAAAKDEAAPDLNSSRKKQVPRAGGDCELRPGAVAETLKACIEEFNRASR